MRTLVLALTLTMAVIAPVASAAWGPPGGYGPEMQGQKGQGRGQDARGRDAGAGRQAQRDDRRDQLNDEERRALHRDLDKANRELYKGRHR